MQEVKENINAKGQALITLMVFMIIGITITSAAMVMILVNSESGSRQQQGELAYQIALSGAENAELRLLRSPTYTGEDLIISGGVAHITVSSSSGTYTILSVGTLGRFVRQVQVQASYNNNILSVTSQKEVF